MTETEDYDKSADPTDHASNHESGGSDPIDNLGPLTGLTIAGDGVITWQGASLASKYLFDTRVSGDTHPRFRIRADGLLEFGPGNTALDLAFGRAWGDTFQTQDSINFHWSNTQYTGHNLTYPAIQIKSDADSNYRLDIFRSGKMQFGPGNAAFDCEISRRASNILNTPDRFEAGTLGVANSANATTPGTCQKKVELFDAAGNSLGFVAVYDAIT